MNEKKESCSIVKRDGTLHYFEMDSERVVKVRSLKKIILEDREKKRIKTQ